MPRIKVAMIGAGSVVFCKNLTGDILSFPEFRDARLSYMDIDPRRLSVAAAICRKVADAIGASPTIEATSNRRDALRDADFVINMVQVGGFDATLIDFEISRKCGLNFTIADTTGPGGLFRALRTYPMLTGLCRDMQEVCPRAILLNYSNPMSMNLQTITRTSGVRAVGLCHSVQGTLNDLMGYIDVDPATVAFVCAGINHMAFYLRLEKDGQDLYPRLFEVMNDPCIYSNDKVRFELMKRLGYFVTESSEHNAEYSAWFMAHGRKHAAKFGVPIDEYLRRCDCIVGEFERLEAQSRTEQPIGEIRRSREYGSTIIHSMVTGAPAVVYGNMPNRGTIHNLPEDAIVEAPTLVDRTGLRFANVGKLPPQLLAYMQPHVAQHELFIRAAMEGRRDYIYQAAMFDPLTTAVLPPDRIVQMCDELIAAHGQLDEGGTLPNLDGNTTIAAFSGKVLGRANVADLRAAWSASRARSIAQYIPQWHVVGPFKAIKRGKSNLELQTPIETELKRRGDGSVDLRAIVQVDDRSARWKSVEADAAGFVDLAEALGQKEWVIGYAYAEIHSPREQEVILRCGSDDGIKVWVNGIVSHLHETGRAFVADSDEFPAKLAAGINRILVKIDNYTGGWGFGLAAPIEESI